jgi:hypothetical protein
MLEVDALFHPGTTIEYIVIGENRLNELNIPFTFKLDGSTKWHLYSGLYEVRIDKINVDILKFHCKTRLTVL